MNNYNKFFNSRVFRIIFIILIMGSMFYLATNPFKLSNSATGGESGEHAIDNAAYRKMIEIEKILGQKYIGEIDSAKMQEWAIKGMVAALEDPYTEYMTKKEIESFMTETKGEYRGIGVHIYKDPRDGIITIISPVEDSTAEKAGLLPNDKIIKIDGTNVSDIPIEAAVDMIKNSKNDEVKLDIIREEEALVFDIPLSNVILHTIKSKMYDGNIGYVRISSFDELTSEHFEAALKDIQGAEKIIIDLRNNGGGLYNEVVEVADKLINDESVILYKEDVNGERDYEYSKAEETDLNLPMAVLINGNSASASEVLAGALKDNGRAELVGTTTFGKGVVQTVFGFDDGSALKVTIAKYYTPSGVCIDKVGINPDFEVELPTENKPINSLTFEEDTQLQKAIEILSK